MSFLSAISAKRTDFGGKRGRGRPVRDTVVQVEGSYSEARYSGEAISYVYPSQRTCLLSVALLHRDLTGVTSS